MSSYQQLKQTTATVSVRYVVCPGSRPGTWAVITQPDHAHTPGEVIAAGLPSRRLAEIEANRLNRPAAAAR